MNDLDAARLAYAETAEEFSANLDALRNETAALRARLKAFDRKMGEVGADIQTLGENVRILSATMDGIGSGRA